MELSDLILNLSLLGIGRSMDIGKVGLVLEGGGFRGVYTSGVLRFFMDKGLYIPYVIGVSMGACNGASYISRQPERNRIVNTRYINDHRYMSYMRLLTGGDLYGMDFIFDTIPNSLVPFDFKVFSENKDIFITTVTDCEKGEAIYYEKSGFGRDYHMILRASCSLPFVAKPVRYRGRVLMDGGLSDPIPILKSINDGNKKNILILTQPKGYRKGPSRLSKLVRFKYPRYRGLHRLIRERHLRYNETMDLIDRLEKEGDLFVIRPYNSIEAGRVERNKDKLFSSYDRGYMDASSCCRELMAYIKEA
jgi:predicted patatin/cPLA2 family phospholipase